MKLIDLNGLNSRRFVVNKRTRNTLNNNRNSRFGCIILVFIAIVFILAVLIIYLTVTFPLIESNLDNNNIISGQDDTIPEIIDLKSPSSDENPPREQNEGIVTNKGEQKNGSYIRLMHESPINLDAAPFLVGLGAEKSGSTSLGAAMFDSGEFSCPNNDRIDVETKYWSNCYSWKHHENILSDEIINNLRNKLGGHCSIKQYQSYQRWRSGKYKFEKSVDYLGLPYVTHIFSELFVKERGTKIFVMIRYPPPRISSTWKFFVGAEKQNMPDQYGNVEKFTKHLLKNEKLTDLIKSIDPETTNKAIMDLNWKTEILPKWNEYMISLVDQCKMEAPIAGFKPEYCNPSQLLRRAVGLSCYIVPIMQWIIDLGIEIAINSFRIIQSELYFTNGKDIMDRIICWSKYGTINYNKCDINKFYQSGKINIEKLQSTNKKETDFTKTKDFSDDLVNTLHDIFKPCNQRLFELIQLYPQLAIKEFAWHYWKFEPSPSI